MFFIKSRNEKIAIEISKGLFADFEKFVATVMNNYREYDKNANVIKIPLKYFLLT